MRWSGKFWRTESGMWRRTEFGLVMRCEASGQTRKHLQVWSRKQSTVDDISFFLRGSELCPSNMEAYTAFSRSTANLFESAIEIGILWGIVVWSVGGAEG